MVPISRELFARTLKEAEMETQRLLDFSKSMYAVGNGFYFFPLGAGYFNSLVDILDAVFGEDKTCSTIRWWLTENVKKIICIEPDHPKNNTGKTVAINVETPEALYDFLIQWSSD